MGLIDPILAGPQARIRQVAEKAGLDVSALPLVDTQHGHASAFRAVGLIREGKTAALMAGSGWYPPMKS